MGVRMRTIVAACAALALAGCATPYQEMGMLGGVQATQISSDTFQITARGNGYTDPDTVQRYALRKAAETTLSSGFDLFLIAGDADRNVRGANTFGSWGGGWGSSTSWQMLKPGQTLMVKMLKGPAPDPMPPGMFDAREVSKYLSQGTYVPPRPAT